MVPSVTGIQGVAFDLEGTVIDVEAAHHQAHVAVAADVGVVLTVDQALQTLPHFIGGPDRKIMEEIWELSDKQGSISEMLERDQNYYQKFLLSLSIQPRPGFLAVLRWLQDHHYPVAIGSLTPNDQALHLLHTSQLDKQFESHYIVLEQDVKELKPAPDVYVETARRMGIDPSQQLVFEDSPRGIVAARTAGAAVVIGMPVYDRADTRQALVASGATRVYLSWKKVNIQSLLV